MFNAVFVVNVDPDTESSLNVAPFPISHLSIFDLANIVSIHIDRTPREVGLPFGAIHRHDSTMIAVPDNPSAHIVRGCQ